MLFLFKRLLLLCILFGLCQYGESSKAHPIKLRWRVVYMSQRYGFSNRKIAELQSISLGSVNTIINLFKTTRDVLHYSERYGHCRGRPCSLTMCVSDSLGVFPSPKTTHLESCVFVFLLQRRFV